jgi:hypothetical protein
MYVLPDRRDERIHSDSSILRAVKLSVHVYESEGKRYRMLPQQSYICCVGNRVFVSSVANVLANDFNVVLRGVMTIL